MSSLIAVLIMFSFGGIFVYNKSVSINHEIKKIKISLRDAEVKNAELKNIVYKMFDQKNIQTFANNQFLVIDKNPGYVKTQADSKEIGLAR